ncbi:MAG: carboxypeptidase-like regulatory domain-containing protein [Puniceicoccaceae bacterium]|nr:carboxypeptidase-like regulatory domain-containing protein [Puniceicoccaceae bacterium]
MLLIAAAFAHTITPLSAIKIVVPEQYKDQIEAIKAAERAEREKELQGVNESADAAMSIDAPEGQTEDNQSPEVAADEFLVQSVIEATDSATEFELNLAASEGIISGQIIDKENGQPLSGVAILLEDTNIATVTDSKGRYSLGPAPAGEYTVSFVKTGYIEANVTEYQVAGGEVSVFPFAMPPRPAEMSDEVYELQDFTVTAEEATSLMVALLDMRQASVASLDVLGSEDFSRFGASDAADALKSVTGVSISGGKFAVVRGLDDRFSTTSLNGIVIPSPDPDRLAVPLDIFPAGLLESVSTQKSYTADQPGESSGGAINLTTKSFPEEFKAKLSAGVSYNENATGEDGFLFAETEKFQGSPVGFAPKQKTPGLGTSFSGEIGDTIDWRDLQFGMIGGFSYGEKYSYSEVERNRLIDDGGNAAVKSSSKQELSEYEEQFSVLVGMGVKLSDETSLNYTGLFSAKNEAVGTFSTIEDDASSDDIFDISASTVEREYWNHQFVFDHTFDSFLGIKDFGMVASYAYSENSQDEPDTRGSETLKESTTVPDAFNSTDFAQPVRYQRYFEQ